MPRERSGAVHGRCTVRQIGRSVSVSERYAGDGGASEHGASARGFCAKDGLADIGMRTVGDSGGWADRPRGGLGGVILIGWPAEI